MEKFELIELSKIKPMLIMNVKDFLQTLTNILRSNVIQKPIVIDKEKNTIICGHDIYYSLEILSAKKAPVLKVSSSEFTKDKILNISVKLDELGVWERKRREELRVYDNTLELLYKNWPTPLVKLDSLSTNGKVVLAKLEAFNPFSNSVKDRIGWSMIAEALKKDGVKDTLYEATSTNTGIALASIANILGKKVKLYMPQTIQKVSDVYLKVLGAEVKRLPVSLTVETIDKVDDEAKKADATHLNQFENDANFKVHLKYTAKELDEQLKALNLKPNCIIGCLGTSGHMAAISLYFKNRYDKIKIVGVQPAPNEIVPGIRRIETGMKWYHWAKFDEIIDITKDEAIEGSIKIARKEGILIGLSAGAVVNAFLKTAKSEGTYILIFPDSGYKYVEQFEEYFKQVIH